MIIKKCQWERLQNQLDRIDSRLRALEVQCYIYEWGGKINDKRGIGAQFNLLLDHLGVELKDVPRDISIGKKDKDD